jgi:transcriptional regulator with XRE-family HTH domain
MALGRNIARILKARGMTTAELARLAGLEEKYRVLYAIQKRDTETSAHTFSIARALGIDSDLLATGTEADIDAWLASRKDADGEPGHAHGHADQHPHSTDGDQYMPGRATDPLDVVRRDVQDLPPELRPLLAQLVTEYITAPDDRKSILKEAIERLKGGGGYGRERTASPG